MSGVIPPLPHMFSWNGQGTFFLLRLVISQAEFINYESVMPPIRVLQTGCEAGASEVRNAKLFLQFWQNPRGHCRRAGVRRRPEAAARSRFLLHDVMAAFVPRPCVGLAITAGEIFRFEGNLCNAHFTVAEP